MILKFLTSSTIKTGSGGPGTIGIWASASGIGEDMLKLSKQANKHTLMMTWKYKNVDLVFYQYNQSQYGFLNCKIHALGDATQKQSWMNSRSSQNYFTL